MIDLPDLENTLVGSLVEVLNRAQQAETIDGGKPFLIVSEGQKVEDVERFLRRPTRKSGTVQFTRLESFTRYVSEHMEEGSRIYVTPAQQIIAILNEHFEEPEWRDHRAIYGMAKSVQWNTWTKGNKQRMKQKEFCDFIEDNIGDVIEPRTDLVELVRTLEINSSVEFRSFERGDNGNSSLHYVQTTQTKAGQKGSVELPQWFAIQIPAFEGGAPLRVVAKLRFDISDGPLKLWYELQRVDQTMEEYVRIAVDEVAKATSIQPYYGTP